MLKAGQVVIATGAWTSLIKIGDGNMPVKVDPIRGQIISYRTAKRLFEHVIYSHRGYIVPRADGRVLVGSTSENVGFDKGITDAAAGGLQRAAAEISPSLASLDIADQWAGLRPYAADGLPVLGEIAGLSRLLLATAHYRNGILLAPLTADLVAEKVVNGVDATAFTTFGPDRLRFAAAG
jgi:glycine oxidase